MECRQAVLLSLCLPPTTPTISPQLAAVAHRLMCFLHVLAHLLFHSVVPVILNESDQTRRYTSLWDFQCYVRDFSITINLKHLWQSDLIFPISLMLHLLSQIGVWCRYSGQTQLMQKGKMVPLMKGGVKVRKISFYFLSHGKNLCQH